MWLSNRRRRAEITRLVELGESGARALLDSERHRELTLAWQDDTPTEVIAVVHSEPVHEHA